VSIKEAEKARLLFLANEADSERRYRPAAHGSAQKGMLAERRYRPAAHGSAQKGMLAERRYEILRLFRSSE